jgi:Fur family ferric uptake transcriptional regulator
MERSTRQRSSIRQALEQAQRPLSPAEILAAAQQDVAALSIATVYRNIKQLLDSGEVQVVELPGDSSRYELTGHDHHHHFVCNECHRAFDVAGCPGDMKKLAPKGFRVESHELTLYGTCADCSASRGSTAARRAAHRHD